MFHAGRSDPGPKKASCTSTGSGQNKLTAHAALLHGFWPMEGLGTRTIPSRPIAQVIFEFRAYPLRPAPSAKKPSGPQPCISALLNSSTRAPWRCTLTALSKMSLQKTALGARCASPGFGYLGCLPLQLKLKETPKVRGGGPGCRRGCRFFMQSWSAAPSPLNLEIRPSPVSSTRTRSKMGFEPQSGTGHRNQFSHCLFCLRDHRTSSPGCPKTLAKPQG